ncbi:MAG: hypothetical protein A2293_04870 [Elusimicrobia bacterium RIFOXYB2_FULL_49_7]|nr:MAG: hypothetical protein A2293_04870 [Elusimicrobia bacterium RIFOXYB2_FULL_49_7]
MKDRVEAAIKKIRPALVADGGDIELVSIEEGVVKVRLKGACSCCPHAAMTLKSGVERVLRNEIPEIKSVESVA